VDRERARRSMGGGILYGLIAAAIFAFTFLVAIVYIAA
jgi:hypothetical protein